MGERMREELKTENVEKRYNSIKSIWDEKDLWHKYTYNFIKLYISENYKTDNNSLILNAGSAGNTYDILGTHVHVDISKSKLNGVTNSLVGDICNLPFDENYFDYCVCVGSVINYCDAFRAIQELGRVLKNNGKLAIEFESSRSYEYLKNSKFNRSVAVVKTFYQGEEETLYVYSPKYIENILDINGFEILNKRAFHIITPLIYIVNKNSNKASHFSKFDRYLHRVPIIRSFSSNVIMICQKSFL